MFKLLRNNIGAADFPASKKTFTDIVDGSTIMEGANVNTAYDEIEAIQTFLGTLGAGNTQSYACSLLDLLQDYQKGCQLTYVGVAELSVAAGQLAFESSGKYRMRENTSATSVTWSNIDTGSEANDTYYVWAVADAEATTFTIVISLSATAPSGVTYKRLLGTFDNVAGDIDETTVEDYFNIDVTKNLSVYDSGWFSQTEIQQATKTHSLGTTKCAITLLVSNNSDGSGVCTNSGSTSWREHDPQKTVGVAISYLSTTEIKIQTGYDIAIPNTTAGADNALTPTTIYARVIMIALE